MPLLEGVKPSSQSTGAGKPPARRTSHQFSDLAILAMSNTTNNSNINTNPHNAPLSAPPDLETEHHAATLMPPPKTPFGRAVVSNGTTHLTKPLPHNAHSHHAMGAALTDTPMPSQPNSPQMRARGSVSGSSTPKIRATTLDIPGLTRSKVSPDGRISERDVGAKLIIIMVGLPARGKSYIVKKVARYLNWLQHPTRIFNVGDRRRVAASPPHVQSDRTIDGALRESVRKLSLTNGVTSDVLPPPAMALNDEPTTNTLLASAPISPLQMNGPVSAFNRPATPPDSPGRMDQSASFFDPENKAARTIREKVAHDTLDDLLKFVLEEGGSVGIFDATNHTQERRQSLIDHIRKRDQNINLLFLESKCHDANLLQANMRLKLSGPDYRDKDPHMALKDFEERVHQYEKMYQPLGDFEENRNMPYCSLIDVGRKMVSYNVNGFLSIQTITYLMNFNLAPRQIWLSRHGQSMDNVNGRIGGDSDLSAEGVRYAKALAKFIGEQRAAWDQHQIERQATTHFPPRPGDTTPPNPEVAAQVGETRNFCVWTSMLKRSIETSQFFCDEDYDIKQMRMLDELNAGNMNGMTYEEIRNKFPEEYELRKRDKLQYRYPGPGGEGYLDIISRLRKVILEVERMTDHVMLIGHRSIIRVLLAYFKGLKQEDISDLDVPLGVAYLLEPVSMLSVFG
jgi:6-phosphofructo-2-kinase